MPRIIGKSTKVVETDGFTIEELAGNVASKEDVMSLAIVTVSKPYSEPWLTLDYDEWIAVVKGRVDCHVMDEVTKTESKAVSAVAGETIFIEKGQRFKPVFPVANTEYIPVCIPAFKPERCKREEEEGRDKDEEKQIIDRLKELHAQGQDSSVDEDKGANESDGANELDNGSLYHMCEKSAWQKAVDSGNAYFPPTFQQDGGFTHATFIPENLIGTANHFYTDSKDDWICLRLCSAKTLRNKCGIATIFEEAKAVGTTSVNEEWKDQVFPHIYGGIAVSIPGIVEEIYPMKRDATNGKFLSIVGLTDQ